MTQPDVIVVGAGLAGCSVAWHLLSHATVLILEQGAQPGAEASAQNAGMIRLLSEDPVERSLSIRTESLFEEAQERWPERAVSTSVGAVLALAHDPYRLHDGAAWLRAAGLRVEWCDRLPEVAPVMAGSPTQRGWYLPDARIADPHALVSGYLADARAQGAQVRCETPVVELLVEGGRVQGVRTPQGDLFADQVVLATGAWSQRLAESIGLCRPLFPLARTLLQSSPHSLSQPDHPWCWLDDIGVYVRPEAGGWLGSPCDEQVRSAPAGPGSIGALQPRHEGLFAEKLHRWLPALNGASFSRGWTGLRTFAPDRRPVMGLDPDIAGLWWATGLGGYGVTTSFAVGEALGCWMTNQPVDWLDSAAVHPGRSYLKRWPIYPGGDHNEVQLIDLP